MHEQDASHQRENIKKKKKKKNYKKTTDLTNFHFKLNLKENATIITTDTKQEVSYQPRISKQSANGSFSFTPNESLHTQRKM